MWCEFYAREKLRELEEERWSKRPAALRAGERRSSAEFVWLAVSAGRLLRRAGERLESLGGPDAGAGIALSDPGDPA
jgi:hypothetical protein